MLYEDMRQDNNAVLLVNFVQQLAQPEQLQYKVSQDQMVQEEQLVTILICQNVYIVDFVNKHAQLMQLCKVLITKMQQ